MPYTTLRMTDEEKKQMDEILTAKRPVDDRRRDMVNFITHLMHQSYSMGMMHSED